MFKTEGKTMKSTKNDKPSDITYPCLMVGPKGSVVLFTELDVGSVVCAADGDISIGTHLNAWDTPRFTPYTGTVTLSN